MSQAQATRILVVDDSKLIRMAAEKILQADFETILVDDGEQAWQRLQDDDAIRMVFSDITMPVLDGFSLLKRIRQAEQQSLRQMPVIMMTTDADDDSRRAAALALGATDFISKPFNATDLIARTKAHIHSESLSRQLQAQSVLLEKNAAKDSLTGLYNRSYLVEKINQDFSYARRHVSPFCLMRFDIEEFNQVFIQEGKDASDQLVKQIAEAILSELREEYTAARVGLSSFVVEMPGAKVAQAQTSLESLKHRVSDLDISFDNTIIDISLSTVIYAPDLLKGVSAEDLLQTLDELANQVLASHRDNVLVKDYQAELAERNKKLKSLEPLLKLIADNRLEQALALVPDLIEVLAPALKSADPSIIQALIEQLNAANDQSS